MAIALAFALCWLAAPPAVCRPPSSGSLSGKTLAGAPFSLEAARGKVVIVNFWATWCAPCRAEMPALDAYYRAHRGAGLELLAVALDAGASRNRLAAATAGFAFPIARIDDLAIERAAVPTTLPTTRVYDRQGVLRFDSAVAKHGPLDAAALAGIVTPLLAE